LMRDTCPDVACQSTAMLLFTSGKVMSGHIANADQVDMLMAL
jgi:hypothetical protein